LVEVELGHHDGKYRKSKNEKGVLVFLFHRV
jgi:hypothetical protein